MYARRLLALAAALIMLAPFAYADDAASWSGASRVRYETLHNQFRPGLDGDDQLLSFRTEVRGQWRKGRLRIVGEMIDSRAHLADDGGVITNNEVNALELTQGYLAYRLTDAAEITIGRFTVDLGSRRLVERGGFRNTVNAFTGARLDWRAAGNLETTFLYTWPLRRLPDDAQSLRDNEIVRDEESAALQFWSAFVRARDIGFGTHLEAYAFGLEEDDSADRPSRNRRLLTLGARLAREPAVGWDYDLEYMHQFGERRATPDPLDVTDLDVSAHWLHAEFGYSFGAPWRPRLAILFDHASGDAPGGDYTRFDNLFGSRTADFGPTALFGPVGPANIIAPGAAFQAAPADNVSAQLRYRAVWLAEPADAFASTGVADPAGASGDFAGHALDARLRIALGDAQFELGAAALIREEFLAGAPNANDEGDSLYGYAQVTVSF